MIFHILIVKDHSLREKKFAATRLALLEALKQRLTDNNLEEIKVQDLCRDAMISEGTFYNYFPKKSDLLYYFIQLWTIDVLYKAQHSGLNSVYEKIALIFTDTARMSAEHPRIMAEIIAFQARRTSRPDIPPIASAERQMAFPDREGIEQIPDMGLDSILPLYIQEAIKNRELPSDTDVDLLTVGLASIFFGLPLIFGENDQMTSVMPLFYERELEIFWRGAGGKMPPASGKKQKRR